MATERTSGSASLLRGQERRPRSAVADFPQGPRRRLANLRRRVSGDELRERRTAARPPRSSPVTGRCRPLPARPRSASLNSGVSVGRGGDGLLSDQGAQVAQRARRPGARTPASGEASAPEQRLEAGGVADGADGPRRRLARRLVERVRPGSRPAAAAPPGRLHAAQHVGRVARRHRVLLAEARRHVGDHRGADAAAGQPPAGRLAHPGDWMVDQLENRVDAGGEAGQELGALQLGQDGVSDPDAAAAEMAAPEPPRPAKAVVAERRTRPRPISSEPSGASRAAAARPCRAACLWLWSRMMLSFVFRLARISSSPPPACSHGSSTDRRCRC